MDIVLSLIAFALVVFWLWALGNGLSWFLFRRRRLGERVSVQGYAIWFATIIGIPVILSLLGFVMENI